jgi:uncharacterized protein with gpF-like domain
MLNPPLALDQGPPNQLGWRRIRQGLWRNPTTGEEWRSWREYGARAGHYPDVEWARKASQAARGTERMFGQQLRAVARNVGDMISGTFSADPLQAEWSYTMIADMLARYQELLRPWAQTVVRRMLTDVSRRDANSWHKLGLQIGRGLKQEVESAPIQPTMQQLYDSQVEQILKIPADASMRVAVSRPFSAEIVRAMQGPATEAMTAGRRWEGLLQQIRDEKLHVQSSAATVARTETARAHSVLQAARAKHIGSVTFQWMTAGDADVRDLHRKLARGLDANGNKVGLGSGFYEYDNPPPLDDGRPGLPGTIYNCRCWMRPILPTVAPTPWG